VTVEALRNDLAAATASISRWRSLPDGRVAFDKESPGTAFFVTNGGLFMTAKHVVANGDAVLEDLALSRFSGVCVNRYELHPRMIALHPEYDFAIGFAQMEVECCFALGEGRLASEEPVFTYGFGDTDVVETAPEKRLEVDIAFWPRAYHGKVEEFYARAPFAKGHGSPVYTHTVNTPRGISGGPLARIADSAVYAVNCASFAGEDNYGWAVSVAEVFDWPIEFLGGKTLRDLSCFPHSPVKIL
jgi:hypothetical protein